MFEYDGFRYNIYWNDKQWLVHISLLSNVKSKLLNGCCRIIQHHMQSTSLHHIFGSHNIRVTQIQGKSATHLSKFVLFCFVFTKIKHWVFLKEKEKKTMQEKEENNNKHKQSILVILLNIICSHSNLDII